MASILDEKLKTNEYKEGYLTTIKGDKILGTLLKGKTNIYFLWNDSKYNSKGYEPWSRESNFTLLKKSDYKYHRALYYSDLEKDDSLGDFRKDSWEPLESKVSIPSNWKIEDLVVYEIYYFEYYNTNTYIFKYNKNTGYGSFGAVKGYICDAKSFSKTDNLSSFNQYVEKFRIATPDEKQWLETCIKKNKFISKEEALSTKKEHNFIVGRWYKCTTMEEKYKLYIKVDYSDGNKVFFHKKMYISNGIYQSGVSIEIHLMENPELLTDLSEIQQYLPDNHEDKIKTNEEAVVHCTSQKEWDFVISKIKNPPKSDSFREPSYCIRFINNEYRGYDGLKFYSNDYKIYSFKEWCDKFNHKYIDDMETKSNSTMFKVGDKVRFKDKNSSGTKWFSYGLENLEIQSTGEGNFRVWESDRSSCYYIQEEEVELMPVRFESSNSDNKEDLLAEARKRYPIGTKYYGITLYGTVNTNYNTVSSNPRMLSSGGIDAGIDYIYKDGKWAEIVEEVKVDNTFAIKLNSQEELDTCTNFYNNLGYRQEAKNSFDPHNRYFTVYPKTQRYQNIGTCGYPEKTLSEVGITLKKEEWTPTVGDWVVPLTQGDHASEHRFYAPYNLTNSDYIIGKAYQIEDIDMSYNSFDAKGVFKINGTSIRNKPRTVRKALDHEIPKDNVINGGSYTGYTYYDDISGFVLPDNWYVVVTEENKDILSKWRFTNYPSSRLEIGQITGIYGSGKSKEHNPRNSTKGFDNEITFEQFRTYVLKESTHSFIYKVIDFRDSGILKVGNKKSFNREEFDSKPFNQTLKLNIKKQKVNKKVTI